MRYFIDFMSRCTKLEQTEVVGYGICRMFEIPDAIGRRLIVLGSGQPHAIF